MVANPDLDELGRKTITAHSLRVTFASLLFQGGANIRTINELMMHEQLGTTARYTPVELNDLRKVCRRRIQGGEMLDAIAEYPLHHRG